MSTSPGSRKRTSRELFEGDDRAAAAAAAATHTNTCFFSAAVSEVSKTPAPPVKGGAANSAPGHDAVGPLGGGGGARPRALPPHMDDGRDVAALASLPTKSVESRSVTGNPRLRHFDSADFFAQECGKRRTPASS